MAGEVMEFIEPTKEEAYLEEFVQTLHDKGYYVECDSVKLPGDERTSYYALVMPRADYDVLVAALNPGKDLLRWEDLIRQEHFVSGRASKEQALRDASQPFLAP